MKFIYLGIYIAIRAANADRHTADLRQNGARATQTAWSPPSTAAESQLAFTQLHI